MNRVPDKIRVRFAPSPTGAIHVGNARTALFNWLFARQQGGAFVLRIEDTDVERSEARFEEQIYQDLQWLGLDWDEGPDVGGPFAPYRQSERLDHYRTHADRLLREGKAYLCFCTAEELERDRQQAMAEHRAPHSSGKCRAMAPEEAERRRARGEAAAVRLSIPQRPIRFHDMVRGEIEFSDEVISDPIIVRSSGMPVYNYVVVIDDIEMQIAHVIRGDDHLSNTPKQVALYEALGAKTPEFAHLSTILGADRERLSKRHGATSIANFRDIGVLPEALMNYLALLGWAPSGGDREIFSKDELVREFRLERVTPSPAVFDFDKLHWLNRHYIKQLPEREQFVRALPYLVRAGFLGGHSEPSTPFDELAFEVVMGNEVASWFMRVVAVFAPAVDRLDQLPERARFLFEHSPERALANPENAAVMNESGWRVVEAFARRVTGPVTAEQFKGIMNEVKAETGAKGKELFHPVRIALTGAHSGPEFDKTIPLIEEGATLGLPHPIPSVRQRLEAFLRMRA